MLKKKNSNISPLHSEIYELYQNLRKEKKKNWKRVLPFNELLFDRWEKAKFLGAGKNASVYDNSYIFGNVKIGENTWVGPYTILDGSGGKISIGKYCSISTGVQIYSHNSVNWSLTGGKADLKKKSVSIGDNCYIGPNSIITMGSKIGKGSVIGAFSLIKSTIPPNSIVFGNPGKIIGKTSIKEKIVKFHYFDKIKEVKLKK
mgnify:FL=1